MLKSGQRLTAVPGSYVVLIDPTPDRSEGGIHLPDVDPEEDGNPFRQMATVLAAGDPFTDKHGTHMEPYFKPGERILTLPQSLIPIPHTSRRLAVVAFNSAIAGIDLPEVPDDSENTCTIPVL